MAVELRWTVFPLHPETPEEGLELAELFTGRGYDLQAMGARLQEVAGGIGLPLTERSRTYNSRRAQELGKWAETLGRGEAFRHTLFHAFFVEGCNIALPGELLRLTEKAGLPAEEATRVLREQSFADAVDADWKRARSLGITAVPTYLCRGRTLVGFSPYADLVQLVRGQ